MTTPSGDNFQVNDDSVVARLSVEIPSGSADSLHAINQQTEQLRVNLEAVSRANSSWLDYLKQVPTLTQQATEAQRDLLVQLERTSYIQQNLSGAVAQTSGGTPAMPQPYSTAAPAGYVNPFQGMTAGMQTGGPQNAAQATQYMQQLSAQNPRVMANMMAQNGMDPAIAMGMFGAGVTPSGIWTPPGANLGGGTGPGTGAGANVGGGVPQPGAGGLAGGGVVGQGQPGQQQQSAQPLGFMGQVNALGQKAWNQGAGSRAMAGMAVNALTGGGGAPPGGGAPGTGTGGPGSGANRKGGIIATAMGINELVQGGGEQIQRYRNLGGQLGGGAIEGIGLETEARTLALDPFLDLRQGRSVIANAMGTGMKGKQLETVKKLIADNLKNLNMAPGDSADLFTDTVVKGGQTTGQFEQTMKDILDYSRTGYATRDEKIAQTKKLSQVTAEMGITGAGQREYIKSATEGYADNPILAKSMPNIMAGAAQSDLATVMAGKSVGITGLPGAVNRKMSRLAESDPAAYNKAIEAPLRDLAQRATASSRGDEDTAIEMFRHLASELTQTQMGMPEAEQLYRRLMGGGSASATAASREKTIRQGDPSIMSRTTTAAKGVANRVEQVLGGGSDNRMAGNEGGANIPGMEAPTPASAYAPQGLPRASLPTQTQGGPIQVQTSGQVNGTLHITVDPQTGKLSAPPTVQLTGTQSGANAGSGAPNNLQPGQLPPGNGMSR